MQPIVAIACSASVSGSNLIRPSIIETCTNMVASATAAEIAVASCIRRPMGGTGAMAAVIADVETADRATAITSCVPTAPCKVSILV